MNDFQKHMSIVAIGHVDSGKSTTMGKLLLQGKGCAPIVFHYIAKEAAESGKESFKFAWIVDRLKAERERGLTIDVSYSQMGSLLRVFTIINVPGHRDFLKTMISGTSQADVAVLIVSASADEFEINFSKDGQTREHAMLAYTTGVKQLIVCVNKMDKTEPPYSEDRFNEIRKEVEEYIKTIGYNPRDTPFIPISGWHGDNIFAESDNMRWYKGWDERGQKTLLSALNGAKVPERVIGKPLRLPIENVYNIDGIGVVSVGKVESGQLLINMKVTISPGNIKSEVASIKTHRHESLASGNTGDIVRFILKDVEFKDIEGGMVVSESNNDPAKEAESFIASITVLNHPGEIHAGYQPVIDCHTAHIACKFSELQKRIDRRSRKVLENNPKMIKSGDSAIIKMVPSKPMCVERLSNHLELSRFVVRDMNQVVAVGCILDVEKK